MERGQVFFIGRKNISALARNAKFKQFKKIKNFEKTS
jgi:hypothetical protein